MILSQDSSKRRYRSALRFLVKPARFVRSPEPVNYQLNARTTGWLSQLAFELCEFLRMERAARGYYPALPDLLRLIELEYGQRLAWQVEHWALPHVVRMMTQWGVFYSPEAAARYHAVPAPVIPLLDMDAPYELPFGTVGSYLYWKLPRLARNDAVTIQGVTVSRAWHHEFEFVVKAGGNTYAVAATTPAGAMGGVMNILRGNTAAGLLVKTSIEPAVATPAPLPAGGLDAGVPVGIVPVRVLKWRMPAGIEDKFPVLDVLPDLPVLLYNGAAERMALIQRYTAMGYTLAKIEAALKPGSMAYRRGKLTDNPLKEQ